MTLFDSDNNVMAKLEGLESGGLTQDFETFYFDEPVQGSRVRLDVKGTTAGKWNGIAEVSGQLTTYSMIPRSLLFRLFTWYVRARNADHSSRGWSLH